MVCIDRRKIIMLGYRDTNYTDETNTDEPTIIGVYDDFYITCEITATSLEALSLSFKEIVYNNHLEIEEIRKGWNNPQKIGNPISAKTIFKNNMIRNRLHRNKLRINELVN